MSMVQNDFTNYFGQKIGKIEILHLAINARKFACRYFPVYSEFSNQTSNLQFKGFNSLLIIAGNNRFWLVGLRAELPHGFVEND